MADIQTLSWTTVVARCARMCVCMHAYYVFMYLCVCVCEYSCVSVRVCMSTRMRVLLAFSGVSGELGEVTNPYSENLNKHTLKYEKRMANPQSETRTSI